MVWRLGRPFLSRMTLPSESSSSCSSVWLYIGRRTKERKVAWASWRSEMAEVSSGETALISEGEGVETPPWEGDLDNCS